jgi:hypothetical protein
VGCPRTERRPLARPRGPASTGSLLERLNFVSGVVADVQRQRSAGHLDHRDRGIEGHQVGVRRETGARAIVDDHARMPPLGRAVSLPPPLPVGARDLRPYASWTRLPIVDDDVAIKRNHDGDSKGWAYCWRRRNAECSE